MRPTSESTSGPGGGADDRMSDAKGATHASHPFAHRITDARAGMHHLPIFLRLQSEPVLVVGGGRVAARKVELLRRSGARITIVAPELEEDLGALASSGELHHIPAHFEEAHLSTAVLVVAATGSSEVNAVVS